MQSNHGGTHQLVEIGGLTISLTSVDSALILSSDRLRSRFAVSLGNPDIQINVSLQDLNQHNKGEQLFDSGALWQLFKNEENFLFRFTTPALGPAPYKLASFNSDFTRGEIYLSDKFYGHSAAVDPLEYPLDELILLNLLTRGRGVEIHACGLKDQYGNGYLFPGQSGAGKTTMARIWNAVEGNEILSDDRIILRAFEKEFRIFGTPWHGEAELAEPSSASLRKVFFLRHTSSNRLSSCTPVMAAARLFACSFPPFYSPEGLQFILKFLEKLVLAVPCYELGFSPDASVIAFIQEQNG